MPGPTIIFADRFTAPSANWSVANIPAAQGRYTPRGFLTAGPGAESALGFLSTPTFARENLVIIFVFTGHAASSHMRIGYGDDIFPNSQEFVGVTVNTSGALWRYVRSGGSTTQSSSIATVSANGDAAQIAVAIKMLATGATVRWRNLDDGAWQTPATQPTLGSADNQRISVQRPIFTGATLLYGVAAEQSDGDISDSRLNQILDESNIFQSPVTTVDAQQIPAWFRLFDGGKASFAIKRSGFPVSGLTEGDIGGLVIHNGNHVEGIPFGAGFEIEEIAGLPGYYTLEIAAPFTASPDTVYAFLRQGDGAAFDPVDVRFAARADFLALTNKQHVDGDGVATIFAADGNTPIATAQMRDSGGDPFTPPPSSPRGRDAFDWELP